MFLIIRTSNLTTQLSAALVKLYRAVLKFLAQAAKYYGQNTFKRTLKSVVNGAKYMVEEPLLRIEMDETMCTNWCVSCRMNAPASSFRIITINDIRQSEENTSVSVEHRCKKISA